MECLLNNYLMFPFSLRSPWSNVRREVVVSATPAGRQVVARADPGRNQGQPATQPVVWSERTAAQISVGTAVLPRASEGQPAKAPVEAWAG